MLLGYYMNATFGVMQPLVDDNSLLQSLFKDTDPDLITKYCQQNEINH